MTFTFPGKRRCRMPVFIRCNSSQVNSNQTSGEVISHMQQLLAPFDSSQQLVILSSLLQVIGMNTKDVLIPMEFLQLSVEAMVNLKKTGRINVVHKLSQATGTMRNDGNDTLMPMNRLPMGFLEYCVNFVTASSFTKVLLPCDNNVGSSS